MKASLETEVEIREIAVFAELAVWEKRPDLQVLCVSARDQGTLYEDAIDSVLPGLSLRARKNLLRHLHYIQLVEQNGALTALGRRCASSGEAPAWEQGVYRLLVASHPLFESYVLDFKRTPGDWSDRDFDNREPLPSRFSPERDRIFTSIFQAKRFNIAKFPAAGGQNPVCRIGEMTTGKLQWDIDLASGNNQWTIKGRVSGDWDQRGEFQSSPESVQPNKLVDIFADWEPQWDEQEGRLAMAYDGKLGQGGRESFLRSRRYNNKQVRDCGPFDKVEVRDIPVGPATKDDARTWATAMLVAQAGAENRYRAPDAYQSQWSNIIEDTPLAGWAGDAPDPVALSEVNGQPLAARTRWLLAAGTDLEIGA
ncbi:MAG: hypothetical protein GKR94_19125 [Gammaproteobacteria bacterium]|nr:hypothetical protein [Gammaproteobacteria bacterium]